MSDFFLSSVITQMGTSRASAIFRTVLTSNLLRLHKGPQHTYTQRERLSIKTNAHTHRHIEGRVEIETQTANRAPL